MRIGAPKSLLGQLILLNVVTALMAMAVVTATVSVLLHRTAAHYQRKVLRGQADIIAGALIRAHGEEPVLDEDMLADGMAFAEIDRARNILTTKGPARRTIIVAAPIDPVPRFFRRGAIEGYSLPSRNGWIVVSQDTAAPEVVTDDIVRTFLSHFALVILPLAALGPLAGVFLTLRLTRQMKAVSAIAAGIGPRTLDIRLPAGSLPLEIEPLAASANKALDRLADGFRTQAAFAADVAHELRTPLAVLRLRADAVQDPDIHQALLTSVDRVARVITQLLALADLERRIEDNGEWLDLRSLAQSVVAERAPAILSSGRTIELEGSDGNVDVFGYPVPIAIALENLIDNASRHTPPGTVIIVRVGPGARLSVSDNGPGVSPDQLAQMKLRFWRADGSRKEGSGIGLSLVQRIADAHSGGLLISRNDGAGLRITLDFQDRSSQP